MSSYIDSEKGDKATRAVLATMWMVWDEAELSSGGQGLDGASRERKDVDGLHPVPIACSGCNDPYAIPGPSDSLDI